MRSQPAEFEMVSPGTLEGVLRLMDEQPGQWLPVAGGTEVMVLYGAGKLPQRWLVNLWNIAELREIREDTETLRLGGGCTFSQIRACTSVQQHFPLLAQAASWTGGIANQNRATIAGNLANASPAADSPPALLVYDAELEIVSARGKRLVPYASFHRGYKRTALEPEELILSIVLRKGDDSWLSYGRKTGARNAQAISKVCMAALGRLQHGVIDDVRIALGAVAPVPLRLTQVEDAIRGRAITVNLIAEARLLLQEAIAPIDDIRSVAAYRRFVSGNLLEEFLRSLAASRRGISSVLAKWNALHAIEAEKEIFACCSSSRWAREITTLRPFETDVALLDAADQVWRQCEAIDWEEAFRSHPRIGERQTNAAASQRAASWSHEEQNGVGAEDPAILAELAQANEAYEARFARVFLVCATGKSGSEMLATLRRRLENDAQTELYESAEQQRQIMQLRLRKWLAE